MKRREVQYYQQKSLIVKILGYFLLISNFSVTGQQPQDFSLSPSQFIAIVKQYHPITKQANLLIEKAKAEAIVAKAGFDPTFYIATDEKTFGGKNYYTYINPELKIPTWYGIEIKTGVEDNSGLFTSPETSLGQTSYLGIAVPIAKNLLMDKRRAALKQAVVLQKLSNAERQNILNDLLYDAYSAYWTWVKEYQNIQVFSNAININKERYRFIKISYQQGERAALDTVEALTQLQIIQFQQSEALLRFKNTSLELSTFLWLDNNLPYQLPTNAQPEMNWGKENLLPNTANVDELIQTARQNHPKLQLYNFKLEGLEIERKLKFQGLLPTFNIKANLLSKGYNVFNNFETPLKNNYKFGIDFGIPLRLSEGRGEYQKAKLKIQETNFDIALKRMEVENKIRSYYNEFETLKQQMVLYEATFKNYQLLLKGEEARFKSGESTLFLLNSRESKVLETSQKLNELVAKLQKAQVSIQWAVGTLGLD